MLIHIVGPGSRTFSHLSFGISPGVCPLPWPNRIGCYRIAMQLSTDLVAGWRPGSALVLLILLCLVHIVQLVATDDCSQLGAPTLFLCRFLSFKQLLRERERERDIYIYTYIHILYSCIHAVYMAISQKGGLGVGSNPTDSR